MIKIEMTCQCDSCLVSVRGFPAVKTVSSMSKENYQINPY